MDVAESVGVACDNRRSPVFAFPDGQFEPATDTAIFTHHFACRTPANPDHYVTDSHLPQWCRKRVKTSRQTNLAHHQVHKQKQYRLDPRQQT